MQTRRSLPLITGLAAVLGLTACATPRERCIADQTRDARVLSQLVAESEANIDRGYGYEDHLVRRSRYVQCMRGSRVIDKHGHREVVPVPSMCLEDYTDTVKRPVAIDLDDERKKLAEMKVKLKELNARASAGVHACEIQFPQTR